MENDTYSSARKEYESVIKRYETVAGAPLADLSLGRFTRNPDAFTQNVVDNINALPPAARADYLSPLLSGSEKDMAKSAELADRAGLPHLDNIDVSEARSWLRAYNTKLLTEHGSFYGMLDIAGDTKKRRKEFSAWLKEQCSTESLGAFMEEFCRLRDPDPEHGFPAMPTLTEEQLGATSRLKEGWNRLLTAVPGSGKTFSLVSVVENAMYRWGYRPEEVTVISFTTSAANEFRKRLDARNPNLNNRLPRICTADSLSLRIVRMFSPQWLPREMQSKAAWSSGAATRHILKGDEKERQLWATAVDNVIFRMNIPEDRRRILQNNIPQAVEQCRSNLWDSKELAISAEAFAVTEPEIRACADEYQRLKKREGLVDFIDIREMAISTLKNNPTARAAVTKTCRMLVVDEYQDTNLLQKQMEQLLVPKDGSKIMAGDENQAIYDIGMGGKSDQMQETAKEPNTEVMSLTKTRRFKSRSLFNAIKGYLSGSNLNRISKEYNMSEPGKAGTKPQLISCPVVHTPGDQDETKWDTEIRMNLSLLAERIEKVAGTDMQARRKAASQCAILCRTNEQVNRVKEMLSTMPEYQILSLLSDTHDSSRRSAISNTSPEVRKNTALLDSLERPSSQEEFGAMLLTVSDGRFQLPWMVQTRDAGYPTWECRQGESMIDAYERWVKSVPDVHEEEERFIKAYRNAQSCNKASDAVAAFTNDMKIEETVPMKAFMLALTESSISPYRWSEYREEVMSGATGGAEKNNGFVVMTMHKSKGLEWDHVQIMGQNDEDDLMQRYKNGSKEMKKRMDDAEKRLLYVAISRARESLIITGSGKNDRFVNRLGVISDLVEKFRGLVPLRGDETVAVAQAIGKDGHLLPQNARFDRTTDTFDVKGFDKKDRRRVKKSLETEAAKETVHKSREEQKKSLTGKPVRDNGGKEM